MNEITVFHSEDFGSLRAVEINGDPWFVGKDVAETLGYTNPSKALNDHVDINDKLNNETLSSLGQRGGWLINESGLYSLVLSSKLPKAKQFKHWITSEVLPSLARTGEYKVSGKQKSPEAVKLREMMEQRMYMNAQSRRAELWMKLAAMAPNSEQHRQLCAAYASMALEGQMVLPLPEVDKTFTAKQVGDMYGISANMVGRIANTHKLKTKEYGMYVLDKSPNSNKEIESFRYNEKGARLIGDYAAGESNI